MTEEQQKEPVKRKRGKSLRLDSKLVQKIKSEVEQESPKTLLPYKLKNNTSYTYTNEQYEEAISHCYGSPVWIAEYLQISHRAVQYKFKNNPELKELAEQAKELVVIKAEDTIIRAMEKGNLDAAKFILINQGAARGWGNIQDINVNMKSMNMNLELEKLSTEDLDDIRKKLSTTIIQSED